MPLNKLENNNIVYFTRSDVGYRTAEGSLSTHILIEIVQSAFDPVVAINTHLVGQFFL